MGGVEVVEKLERIDPAATVLVTSGSSNDPVLARYQELGFAGMVAKPFNVNELKDAVNDALARRR
jgi:two-component system cell cycle sensor histidine kinase/response regulator CckA